MLNLDPTKLLVIAVVAVILLGPDRLPQVARQVGAAWRTFNDFRHRMESEVRSSIPDLPSSAEIARLARSPSALLNHLSTLSADEPDQKANVNGVASKGVAGNGVETSTEASGVESHGEQSATTSMPPTSTPSSGQSAPRSPGASSASPTAPAPAPGVFGDPGLN